MTTQTADWCFTVNVEDEGMLIDIWSRIQEAVMNSGKFEYCRMQVERGSEGGNLHIQGFIVYKSRTRWSTLSRIFGCDRIHWEPRKGSRKEADDYCRKAETRVVSLGEEYRDFKTEFTWGELPMPKKVGKPTQKDTLLEFFREEIDKEGKMVDQSKIPASILFDQTLERMCIYAANNISYVEMKKKNRKALVLHGASGAGKSYTAALVAEDIFGVAGVLKITVNDHSRLWFPPITVKPNARVLIIDEFQWGSVAQDQVKALLSGDAPMLEVKGSYRPNTFEQIIITTNDCPRKWGVKPTKNENGEWVRDETNQALQWDDHYIAVQRRFTALDCSNAGTTPEERHAAIESWLRDALSWGLTQKKAIEQEEQRLIGEGACSQRAGYLFDLDELEEQAAEAGSWTPNLEEQEEEGRLHRCDATSNLLGDDDEN